MYGVTLAGNGWSSVNNQLLLNMMCVSQADKEFLGAVDTFECIKNTRYIVEVIKRFLIEVGP
jgi:hypothetical protein